MKFTVKDKNIRRIIVNYRSQMRDYSVPEPDDSYPDIKRLKWYEKQKEVCDFLLEQLAISKKLK